jgi:hypothetical protein
MVGVFFLGMMIDHNAGVGDCSIAWDVANVSLQKKRMVLVPLVMPIHPCTKQWSLLLIALRRRSLSRGSLILDGKSVWNSVEFCNYSNFRPFEIQNFFPIIKCVPANSEHVSSGSESSPAIDSSNFMNRKMFPTWFFFGPPKKHLLVYLSL